MNKIGLLTFLTISLFMILFTATSHFMSKQKTRSRLREARATILCRIEKEGASRNITVATSNNKYHRELKYVISTRADEDKMIFDNTTSNRLCARLILFLNSSSRELLKNCHWTMHAHMTQTSSNNSSEFIKYQINTNAQYYQHLWSQHFAYLWLPINIQHE